MKTIRYRYMKADGSLEAVGARFITSASTIRDLTRNAGHVERIAFKIDDPKWGTREIDYGRNLIVPLPVDEPKDRDSSDFSEDRVWRKHFMPGGTKFVTFYQKTDKAEWRVAPYLLGQDPSAAKVIFENWRNRDFRRDCLERNQDPSFGSSASTREIWIPGPLVDPAPSHAMTCAPSTSADGGLGNTFYMSLKVPPDLMTDEQIGPEHQAAVDADDHPRQASIEQELGRRIENWLGTAAPRGTWPGSPANAAVTPDVALGILENMSLNDYAWKPELGAVGKSAWFTLSGNPYVGNTAEKTVSVEVEVDSSRPRIKVDEATLTKIFEQKLNEAGPTIEGQVRTRFNISAGKALNSAARKAVAKNLAKFAERLMWEDVGKMAAENPKAVVEVDVPQGRFSKSGSGKFAVTADRTAIRVRGGPGAVVEALNRGGVKVEAPLAEAAAAAAKSLKWAGRVRGVFRYGGRILIVVAIAADAYKIYHARDRLKAVVESAGGWMGATAAGAAFAAWFTPADVAGPWAWAAHGVGTLVAGGVGYWVGSSTTRLIYEFVVETSDAPSVSGPEEAPPYGEGDEMLPGW